MRYGRNEFIFHPFDFFALGDVVQKGAEESRVLFTRQSDRHLDREFLAFAIDDQSFKPLVEQIDFAGTVKQVQRAAIAAPKTLRHDELYQGAADRFLPGPAEHFLGTRI